MKIYVASSWRNPFQREVVRLLRSQGFDVYDFRDPALDNHGLSWAEIDPAWEQWGFRTFRSALTHELAESGFASDMHALRGCDVCVLVLPCGKSAHLELGWAAAAQKATAIFCPPEVEGLVEPELMYKMIDELFVSSDELVGWLTYLAELRNGSEDHNT